MESSYMRCLSTLSCSKSRVPSLLIVLIEGTYMFVKSKLMGLKCMTDDALVFVLLESSSSSTILHNFTTVYRPLQMVGLITRSQLKATLPKLILTILDLYKRDQGCAYLATQRLHNLLTACLLSENGPSLLDFEELNNPLCALLPVAFVTDNNDDHSNFSIALKTYNKIQHCCLIIGKVYPEDIYTFLLTRCQAKDEPSIVGALSVLKHLLPSISCGHLF